jgi:hypothetical protein
MVFQSPSGIEQNKKVQLFLAFILIGLVCGFFIYTRMNAPKQNSVDGVYRNECCSDIVIQNGRIAQGNTVLHLKLLNMKFGLIGYVDGQFTGQGVKASQEPTAIAFSNESGKRTLSIPIDRQDHTFRLVEGVEAKAR